MAGASQQWLWVTVRCDSMELAAEVASDLALKLESSEHGASAHFPKDMERLASTLDQVDELVPPRAGAFAAAATLVCLHTCREGD